MSLGLSFDSKPTKVPKKVIICLNISLIKPCDLKSAREYRKVKESSHTGSVLPVTEQGGDGAAQRTQSLQSPSDASCHLVPVGPMPTYGGCNREPSQVPRKGPMITQVLQASGRHATKPGAPAHSTHTCCPSCEDSTDKLPTAKHAPSVLSLMASLHSNIFHALSHLTF